MTCSSQSGAVYIHRSYRHISYSLIVLIPLLLLQVSTSTETMDSKDLALAVAKFSAKFCKELPQDKSVVSSPLSAEYLLALLTLGSTGDVHTELLTSLGIPDDDSIRSSFSSVSAKLKSIKGVTLNVANKVYLKEGAYELNEALQKDAVSIFDAELQKLNFSNGALAAETINNWVEDKTNNRIKDLLTPDSFDEFTRLVLVNALYFKGTWTNKFDANFTRPRDFHVSAGKTIQVPMMYREDTYKYGESDALKAQLLQLDYVGKEASMVIVLPYNIDGLNGVLQTLADGHDLLQEIDSMTSTKVQVSIPKFKIETQIDLADLLPKLGIKSIFDTQNTGLNKLLNTCEPLYVSKAVQKAFIEVNEEGAEAAAATDMVMMTRSAPRMPRHQFRADRPFLYLITTGADKAIAFVGLYRGDVTV